MPQLKNATTGEVIASNVRIAATWWDRLTGFIPRADVDPDEGLWFADCSAIHTLFMRARIDIIFLDSEARVIRARRSVPLQHPFIWSAGARSVVELGAGALEGRDLLLGDRLLLE